MCANIIETAGNPARQINLTANLLGRFAFNKYRNTSLMEVFRQTAQRFSNLQTMVFANQRNGLGRAVGAEA
jgi:hypothetical protein